MDWYTPNINNPIVPGDVIEIRQSGSKRDFYPYTPRLVHQVRWVFDKYVVDYFHPSIEDRILTVNEVDVRKVGIASTEFLLTHYNKKMREIGLERAEKEI